ncbi:50S ribosomal subunit protein L7/L12 [Erysipelotrichaceae bacterium]|nr:50S ribosomal subunit protein L7/L12 [Erysipelotrichaceae bacterium]
MAFDKAKFIEELKTMTVLELNDLVKEIEEEFGVTAAAPVAAAGAAAADTEPSEVSVVLISAGTSKIPVVKAVQAITGLGLKDAKGLVDSAPAAIKENIEPEEAEQIKAQLEEIGATVEIK